MKLIDLLVQELPKRGGWPKLVSRIHQDHDGDVYGWTGLSSKLLFNINIIADDCRPYGLDESIENMVTHSQYESALAASKEPLTGMVVDDWIEWGGGECPVNASEMVDVIFGRGGIMSTNIAGCWRWNHSGTDSDIIAYRLHQPQEVERAEADDEADLNESIGQDAAPVWNGEGVPPVECECECHVDEGVIHCIVVGYDFDGKAVVMRNVPARKYFSIQANSGRIKPMRTEAERKRDAAIEAIDWFMPEFIHDTPNDYYHAKKIYDAIAAGKIPGVKLDD
ncbi:hypothetical protein WJD75_22735 [Salmonella enterica subsp. enterica serovar Corvallis]